MLNVLPHIFSYINFCVRTLVFFIIEENRILEGTKAIDFLQSTLCFSHEFFQNSLKVYQQTQQTLEL